MKNPTSILTLISACALASCFPKAVPVATDAVQEQSPVNRKATGMASTALPSTDSANAGKNTAAGLRRPDMLTLPDDSEFRDANNPDKPRKGGAVNVRPPTEPPSRPKPPSE